MEKYDAKMTYKHFRGYRVAVAAKVIHGREHRVLPAYGTHPQLLQGYNAEA